MLRIVRASALIAILAATATAGETPNNSPGPPSHHSPTLTTQSASDAGATEMPADGYGEILLNLFEGVLALF